MAEFKVEDNQYNTNNKQIKGNEVGSNKTVKKSVDNKTMGDRIDEAIESLTIQFNNFSKQAEEGAFNKTKCQGALEVLAQLKDSLEENNGEES